MDGMSDRIMKVHLYCGLTWLGLMWTMYTHKNIFNFSEALNSNTLWSPF